jgi:beta-carotene/zeaxanthin 4-ketolase
LNNALGYVCISIYAWFDYEIMHRKHWEHHKHTGVVNKDPDFHDGQSIHFVVWYWHFLKEYITWKQVAKITVWVTILEYVLGAPLPNLLLYMTTCGLTSSFRLFYFGTYLPHRPAVVDGKFELHMPWEKSNSANVNRLVSFLCCYHFDYHWEHHRWPYAPWWDLWKCKELTRKMK